MRYLLMILLLGFSAVCAQSSQGFELKGEVRPNGYPVDKFVLVYEDRFQGRVRDTVHPIHGKFSFQGILASPMYVDLIIIPDSVRIEPKRRFPIVVSFPLDNNAMEMDFTDPGQFTITGSPLYDAFKHYSDSFQSATRLMKGKEFTTAARQFRLDYIKTYPSHVLSLLILENMVKHARSSDGLDFAFQQLDQTLQSSSKGQWIENRLQELNLIQVGSIAPAFLLPDENGKLYALSDWKGKYIFLHFWGSWCTPCRNENIHLRKVYELVDTSRIVFVGVSLDQPNTRTQWIKAIIDDQLNWTQLIDMHGFQGQVVKSYRFTGVPASFLIDPNGKIEALHLRGASLLEVMQRSFKKRMPD